MNRYAVTVRQTYELVYEVDAENGARAREQVLSLSPAFLGAVQLEEPDPLIPETLVSVEFLGTKAGRAKTIAFAGESF